MFLFLNRLMKAGVFALWLAGAFWLWTERERGRPLLDYYEVWTAAGYRQPEPLPRFQGTFVRAVSDTAVYVRDPQGRIWSFGLIGVSGVDPAARDAQSLKFAAATRTNLTSRLAQLPVQLAFTVTNANRTGLGYLYPGTNDAGVAVELVAEGRWRLHPESARVLPLQEQVRLRAAERLARSNGRGLQGVGTANSTP